MSFALKASEVLEAQPTGEAGDEEKEISNEPKRESKKDSRLTTVA